MGKRVESLSGARGWHRWRRTAVVLLAAAALGAGLTVPALAADEQRDPRVVGGTAVPEGKYPFMASLQFDRPDAAPLQEHFCGATLIDASHVMTAAHCADVVDGAFGAGPVPASQLRIVVGTTVLNSAQGQARGITDPSAVSIHPRYNGRSDAYDVAVIRLDSPVSGIQPIRLDPMNSNAFEKPGRLVRVAGWGSTRSGGRPVDRMREARPPIVSDITARQAYGSSFVPSLMVAAGKKGVDTCQGDSGGPLFAPVSGGYRQIGITSFGIGCASAKYPGVYTEVSARPIGSFIRQAQTRDSAVPVAATP